MTKFTCMRRAWVIFVPILLLMLAIAAPAGGVPAAASPAKPVPKLGKVNVVSGSHIRGMPVRLPRPVTFPLDRKKAASAVSIDGRGRLVGLVLTKADFDEVQRPTLAVLNADFCDGSACASARPERVIAAWGARKGDTVALEAGDYMLYVIADGAPVTVRLTLDGLTGSRSFVPDGTVDSAISTPQPHMAVATNNAYWNGDVVDLDGDGGLLLSLLHLDAETTNGGKYATCLYRGEPPVPRPVAFAPGCPGGVEVGVVQVFVGPPYDERRTFMTGWMVIPGGTWSYGSNYVATGRFAPPAALSLTLAFEDAN